MIQKCLEKIHISVREFEREKRFSIVILNLYWEEAVQIFGFVYKVILLNPMRIDDFFWVLLRSENNNIILYLSVDTLLHILRRTRRIRSKIIIIFRETKSLL